MKWNNHLSIAVASVLSVAASAGVTYVATTKLLEKRFQERLEIEIQDAKSYYQGLYSRPTFVEEPTEEEGVLLQQVREATDDNDGFPEDAVSRALDATRSYSPSDEEEPGDERPRPVIINEGRNIFVDHQPPSSEDVLAALLVDRDPSVPYIITREEFMANEPDFDQQSFTYWEGDKILIDDRKETEEIQNTDLVAGDGNLTQFGYGSEDENVLYVRNESLEMDLHITLSRGEYGVEVMGLDPKYSTDDHLSHSTPRKFRPYHDE